MALELLTLLMFLTGMALIVGWYADHRARRVAAPAAATYDGCFADADKMASGPGLCPETVTRFAHDSPVADPARPSWHYAQARDLDGERSVEL